MERAFERIKPGEQPPPPPPELLAWVRDTTYGSCAGLLYGAWHAHAAEKRATLDANEHATVRKHRLWKRTISDSTLHGVRLGSFVSVFSAVRLGLEKRRETSDMWNIVGAGVLTSALTGLAIPGGVVTRLKGAALGVAVGGIATLPLGYAVQEIETMLPDAIVEAAQTMRVDETTAPVVPDVTGMFIERVEQELEEFTKDQSKQRKGRKWFS
jgi:hypothetical protein